MIARAALTALLRPAIDFALPPRCPGCGDIVTGQNRLCAACWSSLDFVTEPWCAGCGTPLAVALAPGARCASCLADPPDHDGVRAAVLYGDVARTIAMRLKYGGRIGLAGLIADHLVRFAPTGEGSVIVPVPLHWSRLWSRGFNQSALIAQALGRRTGIRVAPDALRRIRRTPPLRGMNPAQRRRTLAGTIRIGPAGKAQVAGRSVLLVDDVHTSGATAGACARVLKRAGAREVKLFAWARVIRDADETGTA